MTAKRRKLGMSCLGVMVMAGFLYPGLAETRQYQVDFPPLEQCAGIDGVQLRGPDLHVNGAAGDPAIPIMLVRIVLPPDTVTTNLTVQLGSLVTEAQSVSRLAPIAIAREGMTEVPREDRVPLQQGLNLLYYGQQKFYPQVFLQGYEVDEYHGWVILNARIWVARYNDAARLLQVLRHAVLEVSYQRDPPLKNARHMTGGVEMVRRLALDQGLQQWPDILTQYAGLTWADVISYDYLIITAERIYRQRDANGLNDFIRHKQLMGFRPYVETVENIAELYDSGNRQEKIKRYIQWFNQQYGLEYLLLIGNPDFLANNPHALVTDSAVVPMAECIRPCGLRPDQYSYTDGFYGDLQNWDADGNGIPGEKWCDLSSPEIPLGRIAPVGGYVDTVVYDDHTYALARTEKLHAVFTRIIRHDREIDQAYRARALVAASYLQGKAAGSFAAVMDYAITCIQRLGLPLSASTFYQNGAAYGIADRWFDGLPHPEATGPLCGDSFLDALASQCFGVVFWTGHGSYQSASIGGDEMSEGEFITNQQIFNGALGGTPLVASSSCANLNTGTQAYREADYAKQLCCWANLAATLQYQGAAVAAFSGSATGTANEKDPADVAGGNKWLQREFLTRVCAGLPYGEALRQTLGLSLACNHGKNGGYELDNYLRLNLLGDPSQALSNSLDWIADDAYEDNNDFSCAKTIYQRTHVLPGTTLPDGCIEVSCRNLVSKDQDWFKLTHLGPAPKFLRVTLQAGTEPWDYDPASSYDLSVDAFEASGAPILLNRGSTTPTSAQYSCTGLTSTRDIYLRVTPGQYAKSYRLTVWLAEDDAWEENDTPRTATLAFTDSTPMRPLRCFDADYYRFATDIPGTALCRISFSIKPFGECNDVERFSAQLMHGITGALTVTSKAVAPTVIATAQMEGGKRSLAGYVNATSLLVCVSAPLLAPEYQVLASLKPLADDAYDAGKGNDTAADAADIRAGGVVQPSGALLISGQQFMLADEDWYLLADAAATEKEIVLTVDALRADCTFGVVPAYEFYDETLALLPPSSCLNTMDGHTCLQLRTHAQKVFLRVHGSAQAMGPYSPEITISGASDLGE